MRVVSAMLALAVSLVLVGNLLAADEKKGRERREPGGSILDRLESIKGLNLTDEQKVKVADLKKEYGPKLKELAEKRHGILTDDQRKARDEALKTAHAAGKKPREAMEEARAAMKLTDDQKVKLAAVDKDIEALTKEIRGKVDSILTPEQKELLKGRRGNRGGRNSAGV